MKKLEHSIKLIFKNLKNSNLFNYAAQLSYGLMLAFIPILMLFNFSIRFLSYYSDIQTRVIHFISLYLPTQLSSLILPSLYIQDPVRYFGFNSSTGNITLSIFIIYASIRLMRTLMKVTTSIMKLKETRNIVKVWALAFRNLVFVIVIVLIIFSLYLETRVFLIDIINHDKFKEISDILNLILNYLSFIYLFGALTLLLNWCLSKFPAVPLKYFSAFPGTIFILFGWTTIFLLLNYISKFLTYGGYIQLVNQGMTVVITIYLLSVVFLVGVVINDVLDRNEILFIKEKRKKNHRKV